MIDDGLQKVNDLKITFSTEEDENIFAFSTFNIDKLYTKYPNNLNPAKKSFLSNLILPANM